MNIHALTIGQHHIHTVCQHVYLLYYNHRYSVVCSGCILLCVSLLFKIRRSNVCMFSLSPQSPKYVAQPIPVSLPFYKHIFTQLIGIKLEENVQENKHTVFFYQKSKS